MNERIGDSSPVPCSVPNLWRDDGRRFSRNDDGTYSMDNSRMHKPYRYTYGRLMDTGAFSVYPPNNTDDSEERIIKMNCKKCGKDNADPTCFWCDAPLSDSSQLAGSTITVRCRDKTAKELLTRAVKWLDRIDNRRKMLPDSFMDNCDPAPLVRDIRSYLSNENGDSCGK